MTAVSATTHTLLRPLPMSQDNPVKAGLVARAEDWPFLSARNAALELRAPGTFLEERSVPAPHNPLPSLDTIGRAR